MSEYYKGKRTRNIYDLKANDKNKTPFKLSRSKIDLFLECPKCFYIDRRLGVGRPPGFPFNLNSAVDKLLKQEFDIYRAKGTRHPLQKKYKVDACAIPHKDLDKWRENFVGIQYLHEPTNFLVTGAIDDLWKNKKAEYIVVDYKATCKKGEITCLDQSWHIGYKRQMEVYQWLLRHNGLKVSDTGYFVYCNGRDDLEAFDGKLEFDVTVFPYKGTDKWVEQALLDAYKCLRSKKAPKAGKNCDYCQYMESVKSVLF